MINDDMDNEDNYHEEIGGAESNEAEISERDANGMSQEEEEAKNEPLIHIQNNNSQLLLLDQGNSNMSNPDIPDNTRKCMNEMCPTSGQTEVVQVEKGTNSVV